MAKGDDGSDVVVVGPLQGPALQGQAVTLGVQRHGALQANQVKLINISISSYFSYEVYSGDWGLSNKPFGSCQLQYGLSYAFTWNWN